MLYSSKTIEKHITLGLFKHTMTKPKEKFKIIYTEKEKVKYAINERGDVLIHVIGLDDELNEKITYKVNNIINNTWYNSNMSDWHYRAIQSVKEDIIRRYPEHHQDKYDKYEPYILLALLIILLAVHFI